MMVVMYCVAGVGIVLITVSGIAWRLTAQDGPSCRAMLGLAPHTEYQDGRFLARPPGAPRGVAGAGGVAAGSSGNLSLGLRSPGLLGTERDTPRPIRLPSVAATMEAQSE